MGAVVVKLGSSVVADDDGRVRGDVLASICDDVAGLHASGTDVVVVTSGAIACGVRELGLEVRPRAVDELQAASAIGQGRLYGVYEGLLGERGVATAQILLTFFDVSARTHYLNARRTLQRLISWHVVPIINENDTTTTDEISFGDNDFLAAQVAILLSAEQLVLLTSTDGLYTADPLVDAAARRVEEVTSFEELEGLDIGHRTSPLGSGGMRSKVVAAEMATAAGIPAVVCSGVVAGALSAAAAGESVGTRFAPRRERYSSFKLWLKYAKPTRGHVAVDAGAARALKEAGTSLLPVGVVEVRGDWNAGDAVEVEHEGRDIGKGICNYSSAELRRVAGLKSSAVREVLPRASDEAVHRDFFVLA